jgi:hypothetical protein
MVKKGFNSKRGFVGRGFSHRALNLFFFLSRLSNSTRLAKLQTIENTAFSGSVDCTAVQE